MKYRRLAKAIREARLGKLRRQIQDKSDWYRRELVVIDCCALSLKACSGSCPYRCALGSAQPA